MKSHLAILVLLCSIELLSSSPTSVQRCILEFPSKYGNPTLCDSEPPLPLKVLTTVTVSTNVTWKGPNSWAFALDDINGGLTYLYDYCIYGESLPKTYVKNNHITMTITCYKLPRDLKYGDKIIILVFTDKKIDDELQYYVPI